LYLVVEQRATLLLRKVSLVLQMSPYLRSTQLAQSSQAVTDDDRVGLPDRTAAAFAAAAGLAEPDRSAALEQVIADHLWLADSIARRFQGRGQEADDLMQVARSGLVEAVRRFEPDQGPFLAFAVPTITGVVKRHFRDHGWFVRPPRRTQELAARIRTEWPDLVQQLRTEPAEADLADRLAESLPAVQEAYRAGQWYGSSSLDAAEAGGLSVACTSGTLELDRCEARLMLQRAWRELTRDEQLLLRMRFYEEKSQSEIASEIGTSQMQVSRLLARTLRRLRSVIGTLDAAPLAS
jgi:RNA polymerase sigma-B factor